MCAAPAVSMAGSLALQMLLHKAWPQALHHGCSECSKTMGTHLLHNSMPLISPCRQLCSIVPMRTVPDLTPRMH